MGLEIERKFRLSAMPPWIGECEWVSIRQGYVALEPDREVRVREAGDRRTLTVKSGSGLVRGEVEVEISDAQLEELWPLTAGRRVEKRRHLREAPAGTFEIDVYEGELSGLLIAEVEFASVEGSDAFRPPAWLGGEVTGDDRYANRALAEAGIPS